MICQLFDLETAKQNLYHLPVITKKNIFKDSGNSLLEISKDKTESFENFEIY